MPRTVFATACALIALAALGRPALGQAPAATPVAVMSAGITIQPEHYFLLLFDYPAGGLHQIEEMRAAVDRWIGGELLPNDAVAIASYYGCELQVQQDFTRDRAALAAAVADAVRGRAHAGQPVEAGTPSLLATLPGEQELSRRTANFYGVLRVLAEGMAGSDGRKNLLVFSKGFGRAHAPEPATLHAEATAAGLPGGNPLQEKYLADRRLYEPTLRALQAARISLYPVDLATDYRETYPLAGVMSQLAGATGGRYFYPVTDVPALLARVTTDEIAEVAAPNPAAPVTTVAGVPSAGGPAVE